MLKHYKKKRTMILDVIYYVLYVVNVLQLLIQVSTILIIIFTCKIVSMCAYYINIIKIINIHFLIKDNDV